MNIKEVALRSFVTALEAILAVLVAAGATDLSVDVAKGALLAGVAALLSAAYNAVKTYNQGQPSSG